MPGKDEGKEEQEAEEKGGAEAAKTLGVECKDGDQGEEESDAGGALGHEGDGAADPEEVPGGEVVALDFGEADEGGAAAEG